MQSKLYSLQCPSLVPQRHIPTIYSPSLHEHIDPIDRKCVGLEESNFIFILRASSHIPPHSSISYVYVTFLYRLKLELNKVLKAYLFVKDVYGQYLK